MRNQDLKEMYQPSTTSSFPSIGDLEGRAPPDAAQAAGGAGGQQGWQGAGNQEDKMSTALDPLVTLHACNNAG